MQAVLLLTRHFVRLGNNIFTIPSEVPQAVYSDIFYIIPACPNHGKARSGANKCGGILENPASFSYRAFPEAATRFFLLQ